MTTYRNIWLPEVFNDFFETNMQRNNAAAPAINVLETEKSYIVELASPGMKKEDVSLNINADGDLTIKTESHRKQEEKARYLRCEFSYTKYEKTFQLPDDVDKEQIAANVADGVLTINLPKLTPQQAKVARQITVG